MSSVSVRPLARSDLAAAAALLDSACAFDRAGAVAEHVLFGPGPEAEAEPLAAVADGALVGVAATSARWLRVLAVSPAARGRGVGTALLSAAEHAIAASPPRPLAVRVMDQPGNYLAPGVDVRNSDTLRWLERRGYRRAGERTNLLIDVTHNPNARPEHATTLARRCRAAGYSVRRAEARDAALIAHVRDAYNAAWAFEVERALRLDPPGVHVAVVAEDAAGDAAARRSSPAPTPPRTTFAAFAAHDGNNPGLGWFGPAATAPEHRRRGLGAALLAACLVDVAAAGHSRCEVAWIGPREFYARAAGVAGERRFVAMDKELR